MVWLIDVPVPVTAPVTPDCTTAHENVAPATLLFKAIVAF
jgi:hypothetical protein